MKVSGSIYAIWHQNGDIAGGASANQPMLGLGFFKYTVVGNYVFYGYTSAMHYEYYTKESESKYSETQEVITHCYCDADTYSILCYDLSSGIDYRVADISIKDVFETEDVILMYEEKGTQYNCYEIISTTPLDTIFNNISKKGIKFNLKNNGTCLDRKSFLKIYQ